MTYATVDLGNTTSKYGLFEEGDLISFERGLNAEDLLLRVKQDAPDHLIVCSVTRSPEEVRTIFKSFPGTFVLSPNTKIPIKNAYKTPETLGYDRLAAAVGAWYAFPDQNSLIIDIGTAIKYDFVSEKGEFMGGIIGPGMQMRFKALHTFTKKLPLIEAEEIPGLIGNSTETSIQSGVVNGMAAEINGIIRRYKQIGDLNIIICGGDAPFFESQINYPTFAAQNLVLEGLYRILRYNVENKSYSY